MATLDLLSALIILNHDGRAQRHCARSVLSANDPRGPAWRLNMPCNTFPCDTLPCDTPPCDAPPHNLSSTTRLSTLFVCWRAIIKGTSSGMYAEIRLSVYESNLLLQSTLPSTTRCCLPKNTIISMMNIHRSARFTSSCRDV